MSQTPNVSALFQTAHEEGDLSARSLMVLDVVDIGQQIQAGIGVSLDIPSSELVLVALNMDDSGSIRFVSGNTEAVRDGHNGVIDALLATKQRDSVLFRTKYVNGFDLNPWCLLADAKRMDSSNFNPGGGTPLYQSTIELLGSVFAKAQEAKVNGQVARTVTVIVTDGNDQSDRRFSAADVRSVVTDMLLAETNIIAAVGISDGITNYRTVFQEMGIRPEWILTAKDTPSDIRRVFQFVSSSAVRASQNAASFSQTAVGGFGNP